jgi:hypothetical protein
VPVPLRSDAGFDLPGGAAATAWADALVPEGAETLVGYDDPHLGRWAAVTTHAHGAGASPTSARCRTARSPSRSRAGCGRRRTRGGPARDRHGHERAQPRRRTTALRVELVMGTDELGAAGGSARPAVRDRTSEGRGSWSWRRGMSGCFWRVPGRRTTRRRVHREGGFEAGRSSVAARSGRDVFRVGRCRAGVRRR